MNCYSEQVQEPRWKTVVSRTCYINACFEGTATTCIKELVKMKNNKYDLRGNNTLSLPKVNTTKYGLNSFRYFAAKQWNSIPNELRLRAGGLEFNKQVRNIKFQLSNFVILDARYFYIFTFLCTYFFLSFLILICGKPAKQLQRSVSPTLNKDYVMLCYYVMSSGFLVTVVP